MEELRNKKVITLPHLNQSHRNMLTSICDVNKLQLISCSINSTCRLNDFFVKEKSLRKRNQNSHFFFKALFMISFPVRFYWKKTDLYSDQWSVTRTTYLAMNNKNISNKGSGLHIENQWAVCHQHCLWLQVTHWC